MVWRRQSRRPLFCYSKSPDRSDCSVHLVNASNTIDTFVSVMRRFLSSILARSSSPRYALALLYRCPTGSRRSRIAGAAPLTKLREVFSSLRLNFHPIDQLHAASSSRITTHHVVWIQVPHRRRTALRMVLRMRSLRHPIFYLSSHHTNRWWNRTVYVLLLLLLLLMC